MHLTCHQMRVIDEVSGSGKIHGSVLTDLIGVNCVPVRTVSE